MMRMRYGFRCWIGGMLAVVACGAGAAAPAAAQRLRTGEEFPAFSAQDLRTNKPIRLVDFRGKVVLVDFWATWCKPCVDELPGVKRAYKKYHKQGFEIISISLDNNVGTCKRFIEKHKLEWHHIADGRGWNAELAVKHKITGIPAAIVVGKDGRVISLRARGEDLERAIKIGLKQEYDGPVGQPPGGAADEADAVEQAAQAELAEADALRDEGRLADALERYDALGAEYAARKTGQQAKARAHKLRAALGIQGSQIDARTIEAYEKKAARDAGPWLTVARKLAAQRKLEVARKYYERVLDRFPGSSVAKAAKDELTRLPA